MKTISDPYFLIEVANSHGGDIDYVYELIEKFAEYKGSFGMKFQAFHPDHIAAPDFRAFNLYKELFFNPDDWKEIISRASKSKEIWLDIFDTYGVQILEENHHEVVGLKFQSSVLYNYEVFKALKSLNLQDKKLILNIAAQEIDNIRDILERIQSLLSPKEVLLEFGFQAYPTTLEDSGFGKIGTLKGQFDNKLVFADHVEGSSDDALWLPVLASIHGANFIEKHVMLENRETKYDHFSSLTPSRFNVMVNQVNRYSKLLDQPFINENEREYLHKTLMKPILNRDLKKGDIPDIRNDFIFRRTGRVGLGVLEIEDLVKSKHILANDVSSGELIQSTDFRKAKIGIAVVCRMKSTRLPKKALLKIGHLTSVEYCLKNVLKIKGVDKIILATSIDPDDDVLEDHTYSSEVEFYQGDPEDVMKRLLDVAIKYDLDIISRVTADMPVVPDEIYQIGLGSHFNNCAEFTQILGAPIGTATSVISVNALKKAKQLFPSAELSEYLLYYFINNPNVFKINKKNVPQEFQRDFRMTLDYKEDLEFFNILEEKLKISDRSDLSATEIFSYLDKHPKIVSINKGLFVKYKEDNELITKINQHTTLKGN